MIIYLTLFYINTFLKEYFLPFDFDFKYEFYKCIWSHPETDYPEMIYTEDAKFQFIF